ncbi:uncharacterized protein LOC128198203 [Bicyclus anynana]|uniref:Uncharacterized protein LOC128198203 n=1 Tax=Bicyclus anynana TaxID=110368 RepID=A0ABM3LGN4_BICAN|nr:uncharacterized protein LOC128198203 [Bicyclus anynana]
MCDDSHPIYSCTKFLDLSINDRIKLVDSKKLCRNCLRRNHTSSDCLFGPCKKCSSKHNTLLHSHVVIENVNASTSYVHTNTSLPVDMSPSSHSTALNCTEYPSKSHTKEITLNNYNSHNLVLLSTALVDVVASDNKLHTARVLLDTGSQICLINQSFAHKINAQLIQSSVQVMGVGHAVTQSAHKCTVKIHSRVNNFHTHIQCLVLPRITASMPPCQLDISKICIPNNIKLADPNFHHPSDIDILIGVDKFWEFHNKGFIKLSTGPYLHETKLGWVISGPIHTSTNLRINNQVSCNLTSSLDSQLKRFWELEEIPSSGSKMLTADELTCEQIFLSTHHREPDGRFSVRIPLKEPADVLGDSYSLAEKRFYSLERKFRNSPDLKEKYCEFMRTYEQLGHMTQIDTYSYPYYMLPHHGVINENSKTTKLRTVFDASAVTSTGKSLNSIQHIGPTLHNDNFSILLRFRQYKYVACADIEKMYRQINVQTDQRTLQLILWRENPSDSLKIFRLNTVTYGTASAPYLSIRCLKQLAQECENKYTVPGEDNNYVSKIINEDFFVDDLITGHDNHDTLMQICDHITSVLASGCFPLHKWLFNTCLNTPNESRHLSLGDDCLNKTLGLGWFTQSDELYFTTKLKVNTHTVTKRSMLSVIAQIYDPLGLLSPTIICAKILLQKLWLSKLDWDDPVPHDVVQSWEKFIKSFDCLKDIRIPRHVIGSHNQYIELHIFSDASQSAYGACSYIRSYSDNSPVFIKLLCSKSKTAPLKAISIPRLELCGSLVGAKLFAKISKSLRLKFHKVYFWTDSTIVLGWLRMSPPLLKSFVQNRVTEINDIASEACWRHVSSGDNPADLLSRGMSFDALDKCQLWWNGPAFLHNHHSEWPQRHFTKEVPSDLPELKSASVTEMSLHLNLYSGLFDFNRFSSFNRLKCSAAYVLRFIQNSRTKRNNRLVGPLSVEELNASNTLLTRISQIESFPLEYNCLTKNLKLKSTKSITGLSIFLDKDGLIRIGGRLANYDNFSYNKKHPVLLDSKHCFTRLLFAFEHKRLFHAGPQLLLYHIRDEWWPLKGRNLARQTVHRCVTCTRFKGQTLTPIMGNLPSERFQSGFPFMRCGVDYGGPILILNRRGRGARLEKSYICLFVCFSTRAVHLELVTSLTTDGYLQALKKFISRRGKPLEIHSDNAKTFIGAMKEFSDFIDNNSDAIVEYAHDNHIKFKFIPPYAPHFGGLWEAGIKSCKFHLKRVVGNAHLTYEEFSTVLAQIEAILNSRPISPLSSNSSDLLPLTPAHFLIGRPLTAPASEDLTTTPSHRLTRYHRIEQLRQHFWQRWSKEYVSELQTRTKWKSPSRDITEDMLVLIKEDNSPPLKWRLGRVTEVSRGKDGVARVAYIRTSEGIIQRACSKICPIFPEDEDPEEEDIGRVLPRPGAC